MFLHYKAKEKKDLKKYRPCGRCAACGNDEIHIFLLKQNEKKSKKIFENVAKITKTIRKHSCKLNISNIYSKNNCNNTTTEKKTTT